MITLATSKNKTIRWGLSLMVILVLPSHTFAFERSHNDNDPNICHYWQNRNLSFYLNENCSKNFQSNIEDCYQAVQNSIQTWTGHSCSDLTLNYAGTTSKTDIGKDSFNLIVWRETTNWKNYDPSFVAVTSTSFFVYSGEIIDADIEVNGYDYTFSIAGQPNTMDIQNTLTHEMGHCIGLADEYDIADYEATMYFQADYRETKKRDLSQDDINGLCTIYPAGAKTPLCSGDINGDGNPDVLVGGCATTAVSYENILVLVLFSFILWLVRKYSKRANLG